MINGARIDAIRGRWRTLVDRPEVARAISLLRYALLAGVIAYLFFRLRAVGWADVFASLPQSPWFYLFFALRFLALPISEIAIYEMIWEVPLARHFPAFIRKRVYNFAVMGYSGEAFLTLWARRTLPLSATTILVGVKDNNLLSALASNMTTVVIIATVSASGVLGASLVALPPGAAMLFAATFTVALLLSAAVILFRSRLISLPETKIRALVGVHALRVAIILTLHAAMYASALPGASIFAWLMFIALQLVLSRLPFIPNQDLVYLGAALSLSSIVGASEAAVAGMLIAEAGLSQLINFGLFFATAYLARSEKIGPDTAKSAQRPLEQP